MSCYLKIHHKPSLAYIDGALAALAPGAAYMQRCTNTVAGFMKLVVFRFRSRDEKTEEIYK